MKKYLVNFEEETPKYVQVSRNIKRLIDLNAIEDGEKLPSIRGMSEFLGVNSVTIVNAYKKLESEGYAFQKIGSGTYAKRKEVNRNFKKEYSDTFKSLSSNSFKEYIDFSGETTCSDLFPVETFKSVLNEVLDRDGADALVYQEALGYEGLRRSINKAFWGEKLDEDSILIVSGAQQGIDIASKALINVNDNVIVEKPTYGGALSVFRGRRANVHEVNMQKDGVDIAHFEKILKKNRIKCFYTMSYFQNPTGATYSLEKKNRILSLAEEYDFYIIEDDYLSELIYNPSIEYNTFRNLDRNDRVIYIKSFSKIFLPGIRLGYVISPDRFKENILNSKFNTDIATSSLMQRALALYINKGFWREHINNLNLSYRDRYDFMVKYIEEKLRGKVSFHSPGGGLNLYLNILEDVKMDSIKLFYECKKNKVLITPGVLFYKNGKEGESHFRLGFSQVNKEQIAKGIEIINDIIK